MIVRYASWGKNAVIAEVDTRRSRVRVDINSIFLWLELGALVVPDESHKAAPAPVRTPMPENASLRLDVRGLRADVALNELARFLDAAVLRGVSSVDVIHGKGTGALRRQIHDFLPSFPPVRGHSILPVDQGGDGVTRVELK
jgi:DNA mismatch repair protein MutS2